MTKLDSIRRISLKSEMSDFPKTTILSSDQIAEYVRQFYFDDIDIFESMFLLLLDRGNNTIAYAKIAQGGISGTFVDRRIILKYAIDSLASSVVLVHNHPSGSLIPSNQDKVCTEAVKKALKIMDIKLLDHIIITAEGYYSFADEGEL